MSALFDLVKALYDVFDKRASKHESSVDAAFVAFREAMTEPQIYLASAKRSGKRNYEREAALARQWSKASAAARKHAVELSGKCLELSRYWGHPGDDPLARADQTLALIERTFTRAREDEELEEAYCSGR